MRVRYMARVWRNHGQLYHKTSISSTASFPSRLYQTELGTAVWLSRPSLQVHYEAAEKCARVQSRETRILRVSSL
jgi:hypothetical protein